MDEVKKDGTVDALCIILMGLATLCSFMIVLPPLLLFGGLIAAIVTGNRNFIKTSTVFIQFLCGIAAVCFVGVFAYEQDSYFAGEYLWGAGLAVVALVLLNYMWLKPLLRQFDKLRAAFQRNKPKPNEDRSPPIIARDALTSYSVADELIKWKSLKEEGVIDEAEFVKIRDKLMQKDS